jgi:hypothetical protein
MSAKYGIRAGQEIAVLVYRDQEFLGACIITPTTADQVGIHLHYYDDTELVVFIEAFSAAMGAAKFELDKPRLRKLVEERIAELNAQSEDGEGSNPPPPPTASNGEFPF